MKRGLAALLAVLAMACTAEAEQAADFPFFSDEGGRVRDEAEVLSAEDEAEFAAVLDQAEQEFGPQMAIVTIHSLEGYTIEEFSLLYANAWGLGDRQRNDGLMILVAPAEREVRIEVGLGIEHSFTDTFCQQVIDSRMLQPFRAGDYEGGVRAAIQALVPQMRLHPTIPANDNGAPTELENAA